MILSRPLVVGSNSPRRKEIMASAGFEFTVMVRPTDEVFPEDLPAHEVPVYLASLKAACFEGEMDEAIILCADTVVIVDGRILNKPASREEAVSMLKSLSNKTHQVVTGVCIKTGEEYDTFSDTAFVSFKDLSDEEIAYYLDTCHPFDKAGSYGVQDFIGMIGIPKIEGSFYTVMGLPVHLVYEHLKKYIQWN
ncbi:septum formation protein Maf [Emticicia sp. CRIBPO]|uniref:Maf family nucleotide pyrophosphatase n=1 Tax=Emticicia sp. CRIBPO TaxID=2683258 RepID=UPI0014128E93|nr:Maf family nucleotide pyrophosphatase [Emticicia sp. CRIBPO]NBA88563.1 septum formation protein Maf [Emticicia sp. CRIBPO]